MELNKKFLEGNNSEINYNIWNLKSNEEDNCVTITGDHDSVSTASSGPIDSEIGFCGFENASFEKIIDLLNLIKALESDILNCEVDVIDGVEFVSFKSELELMEFSKHQQDQRVSASQSDDGLEILDDGSFSDISSTHAIVPTKTKDITRIKGWRNKNFVGIHDSGDSGSSIKNEDDGFGDDVEMKSVHEESSEEVDSEDFPIPTISRCSYEIESLNPALSSDVFLQSAFENTSIGSSFPDVEDNNAKAHEECRFNFQKSFNTEPLNFLNDTKHENKDLSTSTTSEVKTMNLSFNHKFDSPYKINPPVKPFTILTAENSILPPKTCESVQFSDLHKETENKKYDPFSASNVYKPRVKHSLIESIARKINADNGTDVIETYFPTTSKSKTSNEVIRWHVPKEKLLCGNIYDLEVSLASPDSKEMSKAENCGNKSSISDHSHKGSKSNKKEAHNIFERSSDNGAFHSSTLDEYTTNLDKLHIDFTIPKLDAADNVTHEEIELPVQESKFVFPSKVNNKPPILIKAKTVAEKKRLIEEMNNRTKRQKKLSFKLRANEEQSKSKRGQQQITKKRQLQLKSIAKEFPKKIKPASNWIDQHGVITYGKEKPLNCRLTGNLTQPKKALCSNEDNFRKMNSNVAMVVNVGFKRPLYKEVADNIRQFLDDNDNISLIAAKFAVSAVQPMSKPFTVTRFLVPVTDKNIKDLMFRCKEKQVKVRQNKCNKSTRKRKMKLEDLKFEFESDSNEKISRLTKQFVGQNEIDPEVCKTLDDILSFVQRKECFDRLEYSHDPQIPFSEEKELDVLTSVTTKSKINEKTKKTKLQRQIELLGGTFIAVESEEESNVHLSKTQTDEKCSKDHCKLGCVCSINMSKIEHCGKDACMFSCQCPVSLKRRNCEIKSKIWLLPEVLRQKKTLQKKLAPVEWEYHQTVIMSENKKTITMGSPKKKRERKIPSKFKDEILLDYSTEEGDFDLLKVVENNKHPRQEQIICNTKKKNQPKIHSLKSFLKLQQNFFPNLTKGKMKLCYVQIEGDIGLNQITSLKPSMPELYAKNNKTNINVKRKSRNVAVKRTGRPTHRFMTENHCSRTFGVSNYLLLRNKSCQMMTKDHVMYVVQRNDSSTYHSLYSNNYKEDNRMNFKEDLEVESENDSKADNELICLENMPKDEGSGLAIEFICSLPPYVFEKQDSIDNKDNCKMSFPENSSTLNESQNVCINGHIPNELPKGKNETIVYATLPSTDVGCKWWVVEVDVNKFSNLIYISDKRSLSVDEMSRATLKAEYAEKPFRIPLRKFHGNHQDKFGAYAVPGHSHLMFFGPYDVNENHGFTAIKSLDNSHTKVPFTSTFSDSEVFKSLGIDLSQNKKNSQVSSDCVKAVWWYSTAKTSGSYSSEKFHEGSETDNLSGSDKVLEKYSSSVSTEGEAIDLTEEYSEHQIVELSDTSQDIANENLDHMESIEKSSYVHVDQKSLPTNPQQNNCTLKELKSVKEGIPKKRRRRRKKTLTLSRNKKVNSDSSYKPEKRFCNVTATNTIIKNSKIKTQPKKVTNHEDTVEQEDINSSECSEDSFFYDKHIEFEIGDHNYTRDISESSQRIVHKPFKKCGTSPDRERNKPEKIPKALLRSKRFPGACPQFALLCLTPGVGYIPVLEHDHQKLVIKDPTRPNLEHEFSDASHASKWLNKYVNSELLATNSNVMNESSKWVMVKGSFIKFLEPINPDIFKYVSKSQTLPWASRVAHNERERSRRTQLRHLMQNLASLIFPDHCEGKLSLLNIMETAQSVIKAQLLIAKQLVPEQKKLAERKLTLDLKLKKMISDLNSNERKKAVEICNFYKHKQTRKDVVFKSNNRIDETMKLIKRRELRYARCVQVMKRSSTAKLDSNSDCQKLSHAAKKNSQPQLESSSSSNGAVLKPEPRSSVLLTEGIILRKKKPNNESTEARGPGMIKPESNGNVIYLIDSDEEDKKEKIIEIESDEDDIVWIPDKNPFVDSEDDVQIISSGINKNNSKLEFPKPKKRLPQFKRSLPCGNVGFEYGVNKEEMISPPISIHSNESLLEEPKYVPPKPQVASDPVLQEQTQVPDQKFVGIDEVCEPVVKAAFSGCSQTDPVLHSQANKKKDLCDNNSLTSFHVNNLKKDFFAKSPQFLPINQSPRINIINSKPEHFVNLVSKFSQPIKTMTKTPLKQMSRLNPELSSSVHAVSSVEADVKDGNVQQASTNHLTEMSRLNPELSTSVRAVSSVEANVKDGSVLQASTKSLEKTSILNSNLTSPSIIYPKLSAPTNTVPSIKAVNVSDVKNILQGNKLSYIGNIFKNSSEIKNKSVLLKFHHSIMSQQRPTISLLKNSRPVPYMKPAAASSSISSVPVERENTVTLHHPSGEISETRTVQFADYTDNITVDSPPYIDGPKIRSPKAGSNLRVIIPKRVVSELILPT